MRQGSRKTVHLDLSGAFLCALCVFCGNSLYANPPVASYLFPAGGQRGKAVPVRVGGLFLYQRCGLEMLGRGVTADSQLQRTRTLWLEGPILRAPESSQAEDYPKDMAGTVRIAGDAPLGLRPWRLWTSEGATPAMLFQVGDLPELVETESEGDSIAEVKLPVTINGRIFPRENVDTWNFITRRGQSITCEVWAARLGSPLDSRIEVRDPHGRTIAENDDAFDTDSFLRFVPAEDGRYQVRIHDVQFRGGPAYVYRLTLTAEAHVDRIYPLGGRRGTTTKFELSGQGLPAGPVEIALPKDAPSDYAHRLHINDQFTNSVLLDLDDVPEYRETAAEKAQRMELPAIVNGRIDRPGDVDTWSFTGTKGQALEFDLRAQRLGSPLHAVLTIGDESGKELARAEAAAADPVLRFTPPADGTYFVRIADRFASRGGPAYAYRLRIDRPPAPDFRLKLASDSLTVLRGGQAKLRVQAERLGGYAGLIALQIDGLPQGVAATPAAIGARQNVLDITFKADVSARIQACRLTIRGNAKINGESVTRVASRSFGRGPPELDSILCAVAMPVPFKIVSQHDMRWAPRGSVHVRRYRIDRNGFEGPLEVSLADRQMRHLQGVTGPTITVPAGVSEFDYPVFLPPWMALGRTSRSCVMAVGVAKDTDGSEHSVSFSSVQSNDQIIVVIEPGRLGIEAEKTSLAAEPGGSAPVPVIVSRGKSLQGPVQVQLIAPVHGITADPLTISADKDRGILTVRFPKELGGPFTCPLLIRATVMEKGRPVVAETKIVACGFAK